jgi:hypothetical protein
VRSCSLHLARCMFAHTEMNRSAHPKAVGSAVFVASLVTVASAALATVLTWIKIDDFNAIGTFELLVFLPCFLAFGSLGIMVLLRASRRAHFALATTSVLLAIGTAVVYVPFESDRGGCTSGMALLAFMPLSVGFPVVFFICWLLYRLNLKA